MTTTTQRGTPDTARMTRAWQEGAQTLFAGYNEQFRRMAEFGASLFQPRWLNNEDVRGSVERIAQSTREVANAQVAVAGEWMRAPLWLSGVASPADLQARYVRLFEAQRDLVQTYLDAAFGWQRYMAGATERAVEVARESVDTQTRTAKAVANEVRQVQQAGVNATRRAADSARETATDAVQQAHDTAKQAADRFEQAVRPVKGKISSGGEKIYHLPGQSSYERTEPDETFATEEEARAAGYRRAQTPGGGTIKGNINREGERIYHLPGQANYDRVEAEFLFESEEQAQAAGFRASQR
jgi:hypothetical protein